MRISTPCILGAVLAAASLPYHQVSAASLTVHTETPKVNVHLPPPKVNVHLPPPKVNVQPSSPKVQIHDLTFTKKIDKSSPQLHKSLDNGKHIPKVVIRDKKTDDHPTEQMHLNFTTFSAPYSN
ncbi:MAG TPA: type VI secretion system tube protein Hcp [Xanthobacteraceae bacterium]|nr:type VI secretion system tube protein Hcp [Xanthobacteraceae bacterium]